MYLLLSLKEILFILYFRFFEDFGTDKIKENETIFALIWLSCCLVWEKHQCYFVSER